LSQWKTESAAEQFITLYANSLNKKYSLVKPNDAQVTEVHEQVFDTEEGPVLIARIGKQVFVSESFDLDLARKLKLVLLGAQLNGDQENAGISQSGDELAAGFTHYFADYGLMRAALPLRLYSHFAP
jgi:hypothetical protein